MSEILIEGFSTEEAFKALCENTEATLQSSDPKYYLVIANELGFDLEFYAKLVDRSELISEIVRYIDLDRFDTSADILMELQETEFEKAIEDLCMAAAGEAYLEDVGILIKNKAGKVISGIDFTLSLIDELQDYEAGNDVIQKLRNQQPFKFTYERDITDYGDFVVESIYKQNFNSLDESSYSKNQVSIFEIPSTPVYNLITAVKNYFGERRKRVSNPSGQGKSIDDLINDGVKHHNETRASDEVIELTRKEHAEIHEKVFQKLKYDICSELKDSGLMQSEIARIIQGISYAETAQMYYEKQRDINDKKLATSIITVETALKDLAEKYISYVREETNNVLNARETSNSNVQSAFFDEE